MIKTNSTIDALASSCILPALKSSDLNTWKKLIDAVYLLGIRVIEFRGRKERTVSNVFPAVVEYATKYPDLLIGIATIQNPEEAVTYLKEGAAYVTSPFLQEEMAEACAKYNALWIPGCAAVEDVTKATALGAQIISILPGLEKPTQVEFIRQIFPEIHFIPSAANQITPQNITQWLDAGALCIRIEANSLTTPSDRKQTWTNTGMMHAHIAAIRSHSRQKQFANSTLL